MIAACPECRTQYRVDPQRLSGEGVRLRCTRCETIFRVRAPETAAAAPPAPEPVQPVPAPPVAAVSPPEPVAPPATPPEAPPAVVPDRDVVAEWNPRLVLVATPDAENAKHWVEVLRGWGLEAESAHDGVEAILKVHRLWPAAVVLDPQLPKMFGFQVCEVIKRNETLRRVGVVLIGAIHHPDRYRRSPHELYGADAYVEEPDLPDALAPILRDLGLPLGAVTPQPPAAIPQTGPPAEAATLPPPVPPDATLPPQPPPDATLPPQPSADLTLPPVPPDPTSPPGPPAGSFDPAATLPPPIPPGDATIQIEEPAAAPSAPQVAPSPVAAEPLPAAPAPDAVAAAPPGLPGTPVAAPSPVGSPEFDILEPELVAAAPAPEPSFDASPEPVALDPEPVALEPEPVAFDPDPVAVAPAEPVVAPPAPVAEPAADPEIEKAERLARIIVSDVVLYNEDKFCAACEAGNVVEAMEMDLADGRAHFASRVPEHVRNARDFLADELLRVARSRGLA